MDRFCPWGFSLDLGFTSGLVFSKWLVLGTPPVVVKGGRGNRQIFSRRWFSVFSVNQSRRELVNLMNLILRSRQDSPKTDPGVDRPEQPAPRPPKPEEPAPMPPQPEIPHGNPNDPGLPPPDPGPTPGPTDPGLPQPISRIIAN